MSLRRWKQAAAFLAILSAVSYATAGDSAVLKIVGPDLKPLANQQIEYLEPAEMHFPDTPQVTTKVKTDAQGKIVIGVSPGVHHFVIRAAGIGFGATGQFRIKGGEGEVNVALPPLAAYASIAGKLEKNLIGPGTSVTLRQMGPNEKKEAVKADGMFRFDDITPGEYFIITSSARAGQVHLTVEPGQHVTNIVVKPEAPHAAAAQPGEVDVEQNPGPATLPSRRSRENQEKEVVWVSGDVRDEAGKPVADADVYASVQFQGAIRMYEQVAQGVSDAKGHYSIKGPAVSMLISGTAICYKKGFVIESAQFSSEPQAAEGAKAAAPVHDFILSTRGASLDVHVKTDEKLLKRPTVKLNLEGGPSLTSRHYVGSSRGPARDELEAVLSPVQQAGEDGIAHFTMLPPGRYGIEAFAGANPPQRFASALQEAAAPSGQASGIPLAVGEKRSFDIQVYPQPNTVKLALFRPGRKPVGQKSVAISWGEVAGGGWNSSANFDADSITTRNFEAPGMWHVDFIFRDEPINVIPVQGPAYKAGTTVAVSQLLAMDQPIPLIATWREGSRIEVHLQDNGGKPIQGTVVIPGFDEPAYAGTTDAQGNITFENMPEGKYGVESFAHGITSADLGRDGDPFPTDAQLAGHFAFVAQTVDLASGGDKKLVCKAIPLGYVRGKVVAEKGHSLHDYFIASYYSQEFGGSMQSRFDQNTGEYIYGPFAPGEAYVAVQGMYGTQTHPVEQQIRTTIKAGEIKHLDLDHIAATQPADNAADQVFFGMGGVSVHGDLSRSAAGIVYYADGKTPAWNARVLTFVPGTWQPVAAATSDVTGHLHAGGLWYSQDNPTPQPPGSPAEPVAVAFLPGEVGATVLSLQQLRNNPAGQPVRFVLPTKVTAHGRVTMNGRPLASTQALVRVLAAHQGSGKIDSALSVSTVAQADGSFDLVGLSPGEYSVQAAVDNIWVSTPLALKIANQNPPALSLDVAAPGQPMLLHLLKPDGSPAANCEVTLDRPTGPLAEAFLPATLQTDGSGTVYLGGWSAGKHKFTIAGAGTVDVSIPKLEAKPQLLEQNCKLTAP